MKDFIITPTPVDADTGRHQIDLRYTAWQQVHGDILAIGTWFGERHERCLVIMWARDFGRPKADMQAPPCIVRERNIWIYDEHAGDPRVAASEMVAMLGALNMDFTLYALTHLLSIVREHIGDLITMPPRPPVEQKVVAELLRTDPSGTVTEVALREDV